MGIFYQTLFTIFFTYMTYNKAYEIANTYTKDIDTVALLIPVLESCSFAIFFNGIMQSVQGTLKALQ